MYFFHINILQQLNETTQRQIDKKTTTTKQIDELSMLSKYHKCST